MSTIATICARGGSKGVPGKNSRLMLGRPLIAYTIEQALSATGIDGVFVSTDSPSIAAIAEREGATVLSLRPAHLATDTAPKIPVIENLVETVEATGIVVDRIVDLDPTSPLRSVTDIDRALELLDRDTDVVITGYVSDKNPYFNMVEDKGEGRFGLVVSPANPIVGRQAAPRVYAMNASIYCWWRHTLPRGLWTGNVRLHEMPRERSIDIDHEMDWLLVERLLHERQKDGLR
ncbi:cytidylyltransferase domain-containing protein [Microbacterium sediminis]|uniref:Flagellar modification protein B n=1 Tax=Microbacterium sediminis TaxID=904291 RepID=A0A1B9NDK9_9MICO|nr:acylneuraminate cytidylyltransferase family protein [Microbacterium sediminis]OCG74686.1 flagellar modification protein B [Microbacterium sediminis]QBR74982.1 acylneuraminate cytidylyltransferase family protein [Microbacterium sediminis]